MRGARDQSAASRREVGSEPRMIRWFQELGIDDIPLVGGKNASLGEMIGSLSEAGVRVPGGFATTVDAYRMFLSESGLDTRIQEAVRDLDSTDIVALRATAGALRQSILETPLPEALQAAVRAAYLELQGEDEAEPSVAVRSSATAEDLPDASFAGQQETFLNVRGVDNVLLAIHRAFASLFTERAVVYRDRHGFDHLAVALSAGIQRMVRSDLGSAGVVFTLDTESGFDRVVYITSAFGLGETVVQGAVDPDEFYVYKPALSEGRPAILGRNLGQKRIKMVYVDHAGADATSSTRVVDTPVEDRRQFSLSDADVSELARHAMNIEQHYGRPMDIEWARDGVDGRIYILQARPETVHSHADPNLLERYRLDSTPQAICTGHAVGRRIGHGPARVISGLEQLETLQPGEVLVAEQTDPDWGPVMKRAAAVVTDHGGRACHAAIVAREYGIPAVVGCSDATKRIQTGTEVTVSCAEGDAGHVYPGTVEYQVDRIEIDKMPELPVSLMLNLGNPGQAFELSRLPSAGVGLARIEFIINRMIGIHPQAVLSYDELPAETRSRIDERIAGYPDPVSFYVQRLAEGIATLAAAFAPRPVIVRTSDFKSNEYAHLLGGELYEADESNPMLGFRGAGRYVSRQFRNCFELECRAIRHVRDVMGLENLQVMVPFLRTIGEAEAVTELLAQNHLRRGVNGLRIIAMCEIPSNAVLADRFLDYFDGYSIGSNDLTQLTLGADRDSELLADTFDERDPAVKELMHLAISACRRRGKYIGICGQGPSDYPDLARWLMAEGIETISLTPDTLLETWFYLAQQRSDEAPGEAAPLA